MIDVIERGYWPVDVPKDTGTYLVAVKGFQGSLHCTTLSYMADPNYEHEIFIDGEDSYMDVADCWQPNPEPITYGWFHYDDEYGFYENKDVVYWWGTSELLQEENPLSKLNLNIEDIERLLEKEPLYYEAHDDDAGACPSCGRYVDCVQRYCSCCGQKLDWETGRISKRWEKS